MPDVDIMQLRAVLEQAPQYKCHKVVRAWRINDIAYNPELRRTTLLLDETPVIVNNVFIERHSPSVGDYAIMYEDGYISISPPSAFEQGYTLIEED